MARAAAFQKFRDGAKKMVAKGKTYGKKKARDLVAIFSDLSITPSKSSTNTTSQVLAPTTKSHNEPLPEPNTAPKAEPKAAPKAEQATETANQDENKENGPRRKARRGKQSEERRVKKSQPPTEISELTSLDFVGNKVVDFQKFCKGWKKEVKLSKIGQGSFATVLKMELKKESGHYSVWKLMPLKPSTGSGSRPYQVQTLIKDAVTEVRMLHAMSEIDGFVQFRSAHVVKGLVPDQINQAHESWVEKLDPRDAWFGTHMSVDYPSKNQLWLLMEMTDAGQDVDSMLCAARNDGELYSIYETSDIFWGIAEALMRGEAQAEFEHRDLHPGNICIKIRDEPLEVTTEHGIPRYSGHEVTLIDYTQSRLTLESGDVLATTIDESICRQIDDDPDVQRQYDVYRSMRDIVRKAKKPGVPVSQMWKEYVPMTNVLWLHHMLKELLAVTRKTSNFREDLNMIRSLTSLRSKLSEGSVEHWKYRSAHDVVCGSLGFQVG